MFPYHILVTLDRNYLKVLSVMLYSLSQSDPEGVYTVSCGQQHPDPKRTLPHCLPCFPAPSW